MLLIIEHWIYYIPTAKLEDCNVTIDGRIFFNQPIKNNVKTYENISRHATAHGDHDMAGCLLL